MQISDSLLRVLLVDDEPFIRKGLAALIDWEAEGYCVAGEASNGNSAIQLLKQNDYDLIISDIKMPEMDGIELITYVRSNKISMAKFVFLSGFYDFHYAKTAIQCGCCDYILKPIQREELLATIRKVMDEYQKEAGTKKKKVVYDKDYLDRHLMAIICGEFDSNDLKYVENKMLISDEMAYIHCEISLNDEKFSALSENERMAHKRKLNNYAKLLLKNNADHIIYDIKKYTQCYDIGIVYCSYMARERGLSQEEWLSWLLKELSERVGYEIVACMGSKVNSLNTIADSYREAVMIRSFRFYKKHDNGITGMMNKEPESQCTKVKYDKKQLDELIHFIEINDKFKIKENANSLYILMMDKNIGPEVVSRNIQYLLYRLLGLGYNQDADINQEEIMQYIRETVFVSKTDNENGIKFQQFAIDYSDYLAQLRQNTAKGTIEMIETEIEEKYAENLSLKSFGEKYFINSAYLGQVFKKQYGCAFKDYLNSIRIRKSAEILLHTDKLVCEIAVDVGYKSQEYFINKFEEVYGVTPTRFRKRNQKDHTPT